ncbi:MAG: hypothetical protein M1834_008789 [Cirrosporium novae-zelandiae]|nr:MAG: hypothetical protein M1834_008789 [Cirrosporium novae-zelandiae]
MSSSESKYNYLSPFCNLPFRTKTDLQDACIALLEPLTQHFSPEKARIKVGTTAAHFDESAAQLEGYARPLWALCALVAGGYEWDGTKLWVKGLINGTDPNHAEYWGAVEDVDQRMVEMCPIGFMLIVAPDTFWNPLTEKQKENVAEWLGKINEKKMPNNNWLWFRVFTNLGLKYNGAPHSIDRIKADVEHLDTFYVAEGFSNDGSKDHVQMDYYSGSFAIQYLQLLYSKFAVDIDPKRCQTYKIRAQDYAKAFVHYFDPEGRAIPFGRSLTYRFAMASFWSAFAFADVDPPAPMTWSHIRGLLLRNLRWWAMQPGIFSPSGTLTIGYTYSQMYLAENYNSPQSPYWACISLLTLALPTTHPFWSAKEAPWPTSHVHTTVPLDPPKHIISHLGNHTFLLSSGQSSHYDLKAGAAKYGKFAYSSSFGYSVPTGPSLSQSGLDSVFALSDDNGETWKPRSNPHNARIEKHGDTPVLVADWKPWSDVEVQTWLIPPLEHSPNWHTRIHHIRTNRDLKTCEGSFSLYGMGSNLRALTPFPNCELASDLELLNPYVDGTQATSTYALAVSSAGASGILTLTYPTSKNRLKTGRGEIINADPNSNIMTPKTVIPSFLGDIEAGKDIWLVSRAFAVPASGGQEWRKSWRKLFYFQPEVEVGIVEKIINPNL